jgi:hypothetical protein
MVEKKFPGGKGLGNAGNIRRMDGNDDINIMGRTGFALHARNQRAGQHIRDFLRGQNADDLL